MKQIGATVLVLLLGVLSTAPVHALEPVAPSFQETWDQLDGPVLAGEPDRTWLFGPSFDIQMEPYADSPNRQRLVQYFDKARMEINHPTGSTLDECRAFEDCMRSRGYVTNGLLALEMITGMIQVSDTWFEPAAPAEINVAGDPDDPTAPTYATFNQVRSLPPRSDLMPITERISRDGTITNDPSLVHYSLSTPVHVSVPNVDHKVANPFLTFNERADIGEGPQPYSLMLFNLAGLPVTEAYWANVKVAGTYTDVLIQCFERRCLTWTPDNSPPWQVESGNVGRHYYTWRYGDVQPTPAGHFAYISQTTPADENAMIAIAHSDGKSLVESAVVEQVDAVAAWSSPAWSPDGRQVAYVSRPPGHLWISNADGSDVRQVPLQLEAKVLFSLGGWSPDGSQIMVYWTTGGGVQNGFVIVSLDGAILHSVSGAASASASWSPDGSRIIYQDTALRLTILDLATGTTTTLVEGMDPAWTPSGDQLVFLRDGAIHRIDADGTDPIQFTDPMTFPTGIFEMTLAPDGQRIAFTVDEYNEPPDGPSPYIPFERNLWMVTIAGSHVTRLTDSQSCSAPSWSPDSRIVGYSDGGDHLDMVGVIRFVNVEHPDWIYTPLGYGSAPRWSPVP